MKWPLLPVALLYVGGILLGSLITVSLPLLLGSGLGLVVTALVWDQARPVLLHPLLVLTGWAGITLHTAVLSPNDLRRILGREPQIVSVRGTLSETPTLRVYEHEEQESWRSLAKIKVSALRIHRGAWQAAVGRMAVTTPGTLTNLFAGQTVEITGIARLPKLAAAEGTFDYRRYLSELEIYYQLQTESANDWEIISSPKARPLADRFRDWARPALARGLPIEDESLRLEWALTLGWKTALTEEVSEPFVRAATYHIFAVDGLRMAIVFGIFFALFRALRLPRAVCGVVLIPLIWFYTGLTGWPASAIRASVMLTVVIIGWALKRPSDLINSLLAAALIILIWQPQQLYQAGFQLSFFVVLCILVTVPVLQKLVERLFAPDPLLPKELHPRWHRIFRTEPMRYLGGLLLTSFAAWIGSLPLVAYYFHILTPVSTPANIVAVPLCALVLVSNLAGLMLAAWFSPAAILFNHAGWFLMECIRVTSQWFADWPRAYWYVSTPSVFTIELYYALLLTIATGWLFRPKMRAWKISVLAVLVSGWCVRWWHVGSATRLTILTLNGGGALFFDGPAAREDLLINCGATNAVRSIIKPFLRAQGVNRLPALLLTHGEVRHVGGAEMVADLFSVKQVCVSPVRFRSAPYRQILAELSLTPGLVRTLSRKDHLGAWTILHPEADDQFPQADDNSIVLFGTFGRTRVLLLSDLGRPGQNALLDRISDLRADVVVTGIPVQTEAVGDGFLDAIQPRLIIVADSEFPPTARASAKLRERLARRGVPVIYTRQDGAVTLEIRKQNWEARTMSRRRVTSNDTGAGRQL